MNYIDLKEVIKHLKKVLPCSTCEKKFTSRDFYLLSTFQNEGLFHLHCHNCHNELLVHVAISYEKKKNSVFNIQTRPHGRISANEVLDMHNFLNKFNGDFKAIFPV